jgi:hypothetical protein
VRFAKFSFGSIRIDGSAYEHDAIIDRGEQKKTLQEVPRAVRHTPLAIEEEIS